MFNIALAGIRILLLTGDLPNKFLTNCSAICLHPWRLADIMKVAFPVTFFLLFCMSSEAAFSMDHSNPGPGPTIGLNKTVIINLVNEVRKKGCKCGDTYYYAASPLIWNEQLEKAAFEHSNDMYRRNYFSHVSPEGFKAGDRIEKAGYHWMMYGENIGMGYKNEKEMVEGWLKSPGHCKNIMNKGYKEMAVAKVGSYWTQTFGAR